MEKETKETFKRITKFVDDVNNNKPSRDRALLIMFAEGKVEYAMPLGDSNLIVAHLANVMLNNRVVHSLVKGALVLAEETRHDQQNTPS
jgi:hypothetical protein